MKTKLQVGQRVVWNDEPGQVVTIPAEFWEEYGVKLDSGQIIFDIDSNLLTTADLERMSTEEPILT